MTRLNAPSIDPALVIEARRRLSLQDLREAWEFRALFWRFAQRDITVRYRQTALGVTWVVLQPLLAAGIFGLVFGRIAKLPSNGIPYFVLSFAGMLGWQLFNSTLTKLNASLIGNAGMISKVFFPRIILPLSAVIGVLVDFVVAFALLIILVASNDIGFSLALAWLPVAVLLLLLIGVGVGLGCAALTVSYRDVAYAVPVVVQFLLYASPVAYTLAAVPHSLKIYFEINPLTAALELVRHSTLGTPMPSAGSLAYSAALAVAFLLLGYLLFKSRERKFADVI